MKFGTAEGTAVPNFTLISEYLGFPVQKNAKNCQNFQLFHPTGANPLPDVDEIRKVYAGNWSTKQKLLIFVQFGY